MWQVCGILLFHLIAAEELYTVPHPRLEAFTPKGFRASIPDSPGVQLFAFHWSLNNPLHDVEAGQWNRDIVKSRDGFWTYEEPDVQLKIGDVINYWIFVQVDGLGYTKTNQRWSVPSLQIRDDDRIATADHSTGEYKVPEARIEALHPKGLRVSIPDEPGIELFAFHGKINVPLTHDLDGGSLSRDIVKPKNGRWTFEDKDVRLRDGDIIYYWLYVIVDGLGYHRLKQQWIVRGLEDHSATADHPKAKYKVPEARLEALHPTGLRVSIPDEAGMELFAFHGKINVPLVHDLEAGSMSRDILRPKSGRWTYEDKQVRLRNGDIIYYWLYAIVDGVGYQRLNQKWVVTGLGNNDEDHIATADHSTGEFKVPEAKFEALHPKGLRVSIPDEPGMELFAFHGRVNVPLVHDLEAGSMSRDIVKSKNGRWTFEDRDVELRNGDIIYYWLYFIVNGLGYQKLNQKWIVTGASDGVPTEDSVSGSPDRPATEHTTHEEPEVTTAGYFPQQVNFKLPEGMELVVVVKDGKLLLKKPLPPQVAFEGNQIPPIGFCKSTEICVPSPKIPIIIKLALS